MFEGGTYAQDDNVDNSEDAIVDEDIGKSRDASRTDDEVVARFVDL